MFIVDMHCDTIWKLFYDYRNGIANSLYQNKYHIDIKKLYKSNYLIQNFAIFTDLKEVSDRYDHVNGSIACFYEEMERHKEFIQPIYTYQDIEKCKEEGKVGALLTLEEGDVVFDSIDTLEEYYELGVRMIALTWNHPNSIGYPGCYEKDLGLTEFGIAYIKEMERLGMMIDVSHLSDAGFKDVFKYTTKPIVASHSNARSVCDVSRNLTDEQIRCIDQRGGVIGINFYGPFLQKDQMNSRVEDMVKHIQYIRDIGSIDVIGLGSDFDGIEGKLELRNAGYMYLLLDALKEAGFSEEDIDKITSKNVLRVYQQFL
ncbi:dipeptidase [Tannockella kyphosi]|uniref:dipeptidase n=1 Tax=Tannockella kyphosi TaxID=2899121 RepID=UPI002013BF70|nr:dipeptidase [Tannockella kyphosi]